MGTLRLLLAVSVVLVHSGPVFGLKLVDGVTAVQAFYVISGFYMAMILTDKYPATVSGTMLFYGNRFLRIFPLYWVVLTVTVGVFAIALSRPGDHNNALALILNNWNKMPLPSLLFLITSNIGILGLDYTHFLRVDVRGLQMDASQFAIVPQAWTLGIELVVYLLAPLVFRSRPWVILALAAVSLVARAVAYQAGLQADPWDYRFFPFEFALFCLGALAYRATPLVLRKARALGAVGAALLAAMFLAYPLIPDVPVSLLGFRVPQLSFLVIVVAFIAPLFEITKNSLIDRSLGDLSYPIYLGHLITIQVLAERFDPEITAVLSLPAAILFALFLVRITKPFETLRKRRASAAQGAL